jgi:hypothetical protein
MSQRTTRVRLLAVIAVLGLVVAACGGGGDADSGVATLESQDETETLASQEDPTTGGDAVEDVEQTREEALLAFTACLRENGIDIEDPTVDADGNVQLNRPGGQPGADRGANEEFRAAREACSELLADAALGFGDRVDRTELEDNLVQFATCMRDNGYDMPDPDFSSFGPGQGGGGGPFGEIDREDPAFQEASAACEDVLAGFGGGLGGGRPGGGG